MTDQITTKPGHNHGPSIKNPRVYEALRNRRGMSKRQAARISNAKKDASTDAGVPLNGPGSLLGYPGMDRTRKWGNRKRLKACTCGVNIATKEQIAPGITRIRGNLCNVHGRYGPCDAAQSGKKKPKGRKPAKAKKPTLTPEQRAQQRAAAHDQARAANRQSVVQAMADSDSGLAPASANALLSFADGREDPAYTEGLISAGLMERGRDGAARLTAAGRVAVNAMNRGDSRGAIDAVGRGTDQKLSRVDRQSAAAQRKQDVAKRRAEAAARRAAKKPKAGGGGKQGKPSSSASSSSSTSREQERQQRAAEHAQDRAQRQREHAEDRARRQREHEQDRAAQQQRPTATRPAPAQRAQPIARSRGAPLIYGNQGAHRRRKSFTVFKDHTGAYRWIARTTTAYRDRDGEIITTKALEADAARMSASGQFGPLRYWHIGEPDPFDPVAPWGPGLDIGDCDYSVVIGRTSIESGTFKSAAIGRAFAESADDYELSPGFFHPPDQPNMAGEYDAIRRFERSPVPIAYGRASNLFTGMTVKEFHMDQATYDARVKAFTEDMNKKGVPPEVAAQALAGMQQADKSAEQQGIAFKSDDRRSADPWQAVIVALKAALVPAEKAPTPMDAEDDPAMGGDSGVDEAAEGEPPIDAGDGGDYIGDMSVGDFRALLAEILAPVLKMQEMHKAIGDMHGELKGMLGSYATKDAGHTAEITALKARLVELEGHKPAVGLPAEVEAALKSGGPTAPPDPQTLPAPENPLQALAMQTAPELYRPTVAGYNGAAGWQFMQPPPSNTGGN